MPAFDSNDCLNFNCSLSVHSGCSASMSIVRSRDDIYLDPKYFLGEAYSLYITIDEETHMVFKGIVDDIQHSVDSDYNLFYNVGLISQTANLSRKPINTETYGLTTAVKGDVILEDIFIKYGSIDASLIDMSVAAESVDFNFVTLMGDSCIEEARKVAQAAVVYDEGGGYSLVLYTNHEGILVCNRLGGAGEVSMLGENLYKSASKSITRQDAFSKVRVRGRYQSLDESGPSEWFNKTVTYNIDSDQTEITIQVTVNATRNEILASRWTSSSSNVSAVHMAHAGLDGTGRFIFYGNFDSGGSESVNLTGNGPRSWGVEKDSMSLMTIQNMKADAHSASRQLGDRQQGRSSFVKWAWVSQKDADAHEEGRIDIVGADLALQEAFGVRFSTIDNPYIPTAAACSAIGEDYFRAFKQSQEVWEFQCVFDPNIKINTTIEFYDPFTQLEVFGFVVNIDISYSPGDANADMKLTVEKCLLAACE